MATNLAGLVFEVKSGMSLAAKAIPINWPAMLQVVQLKRR
jgi:hypothetical protein